MSNQDPARDELTPEELQSFKRASRAELDRGSVDGPRGVDGSRRLTAITRGVAALIPGIIFLLAGGTIGFTIGGVLAAIGIAYFVYGFRLDD